MWDMESARREYEREHEAYRAAVARLTPKQRDAWAAVEEAHEWFDGESAIAHGTLERMLDNGTLLEQGRVARSWR